MQMRLICLQSGVGCSCMQDADSGCCVQEELHAQMGQLLQAFAQRKTDELGAAVARLSQDLQQGCGAVESRRSSLADCVVQASDRNEVSLAEYGMLPDPLRLAVQLCWPQPYALSSVHVPCMTALRAEHDACGAAPAHAAREGQRAAPGGRTGRTGWRVQQRCASALRQRACSADHQRETQSALRRARPALAAQPGTCTAWLGPCQVELTGTPASAAQHDCSPCCCCCCCCQAAQL